MGGQCPKCDATVTHVILESTDIHVQLLKPHQWKGVSYLCPHCRAVLGIQIDPIALKADLLKGIKKLLQEK